MAHILITSAWFPSSNSTNGIFVKEQAEALAESGHTVSLIFVQHRSLRDLINSHRPYENTFLNSKSINLFFGRVLFQLPFRFSKDPLGAYRSRIEKRAIRILRQLVASHGCPDIIHHHCMSDNAYLCSKISRDLGIPYVITEHSNYFEYKELRKFNPFETFDMDRAFVQGAAKRIAVSGIRAAAYSEIFSAPFVSVPNLVSNLFEAPLPKKAKAPFSFICVAVLDERKRQDVLIEAFAKTFRGSDARLVLVGNGHLAGSYAALAERLGISEQIDFKGIQSREVVLQLMDQAHVAVLSSDQETFGVALVEAMFRGLPVISTRSGGPEEIIDESSGLVVPVGDPDAMASAMAEIHRRYEQYDPHSIRNSAIARFSEQEVVKRLEAIYGEVLGGQAASRAANGQA